MKTKHVLLCFLLFGSFAFSQDINQFDAQGKRHGIWKKNFDDSNVLRYEGAFSHGKEIGLFKFYKNIGNKAVLTATKQFNEKNNKAEVRFLSSTGKLISEGLMDGKRYVSTWKYYQKNSNALLILEHYNDVGKLEGERFVYYPNGQIAEKQHYKNGKREGLSQWFSEKNVVLKTFIYENDTLHGASKIFNPKGELIIEGFYNNGKKHGIWKYYENKTLIEEKNFTEN
ncbi:toxin-antitoxin system YwqK family antitoxin [Mariniflexile ostreae]|uniref:Toxin-antitoxin system YwqK family antitoxin n=1 Tax=Mariniflexile ostreae TaxID=1520892 RepID=A0ABV5FC27_9FLAO